MDFNKIFSKFDIRGSFLEDLLKIMDEENFIDPFENFIPADDEEKIGELDFMEKALSTLIEVYKRKVIEYNEKINDPNSYLSDQDLDQINRMCKKIKGRCKTAVCWLLASTGEHFDHLADPDDEPPELRSKFRMVLSRKKKLLHGATIGELAEIILAVNIGSEADN